MRRRPSAWPRRSSSTSAGSSGRSPTRAWRTSRPAPASAAWRTPPRSSTPRRCTPAKNVAEEIIAHETAHQWFGDAVTEADWHHLWLSEGFATYLAALWLGHVHGDSAFQAKMQQHAEAVFYQKGKDGVFGEQPRHRDAHRRHDGHRPHGAAQHQQLSQGCVGAERVARHRRRLRLLRRPAALLQPLPERHCAVVRLREGDAGGVRSGSRLVLHPGAAAARDTRC